MNLYLTSYASGDFIKFQRLLENSAYRHGIDKVFSYTRQDLIKTEFYRKYNTVLNFKRGGGYWLWKPYFILKALNNIKNNDILVYSDAGIKIIGDLTPLFNIVNKKENGILLFKANHKNSVWTKRDCFILMGCDSKKYWEGEQAGAFFQVYKKTAKSVDFVKEWLYFCQNEHILTDMPNICGLPNLEGFKEHRHDQSILSLLAIKHKIKLFPDPTQYGGLIHRSFFNKKAKYGTLLYHHRGKQHNYCKAIIYSGLITMKRILVNKPN